MSLDVFQHNCSGSKNANGFSDPRPDMSLICESLSLPGSRERLARISGGDHIYLADVLPPVDLFQVAELCGVREPYSLHSDSVSVDV